MHKKFIKDKLIEIHQKVLMLGRWEIDVPTYKMHVESLRDKAQAIIDMLNRIEGAKNADTYKQD